VLAAVLSLACVTAPVGVVEGAVQDALLIDGAVWLTTARKGERALVRFGEPRSVVTAPADAVFVDACPSGRVVFADARGLVDAWGVRLLEGRGLFTVPDPTTLLVADLCGSAGAAGDELRVPVVDGIAVMGSASAGGVVLRFRHDARAYSGRVHRGLRPDRGYAEALSLYGPRLFDVDADGDGDTDLVAVREGRLSAWRRHAGGLDPTPFVERNLAHELRAGDDADLRVRLLDVDGDRVIDAVVGVTRGAVPERSEAWLLSAKGKEPFASSTSLWKSEGLRAAIGHRGRSLVIAAIDTSLVSLSAVVLTGRIPVKVALTQVTGLSPAAGGTEGGIALQAKVDVRAGRMDGALPIVNVDLDGDGVADLLDLGEPGRAALHKGTKDGFELDAKVVWDVPSFVHVVAMPELPGVVLLGAPLKGQTRVVVLAYSRGG
jgi:hypothetical protein